MQEILILTKSKFTKIIKKAIQVKALKYLLQKQGSKHLNTTAIYGSQKKWPQNCHRLQFCPHFYLWIKTANGCSSMASQQNCKRWQFCGQFSEFMAYVSTKLQTLAVLWPLFGVYRMLSPPELQTLAVLWPLFGVYIKVAI